jgi:hypothetical protein
VTLLLQTRGACDFDPGHLLAVFGGQQQHYEPMDCTIRGLHGFWDSWPYERDALLARGMEHPTDGDATG